MANKFFISLNVWILTYAPVLVLSENKIEQ